MGAKVESDILVPLLFIEYANKLAERLPDEFIVRLEVSSSYLEETQVSMQIIMKQTLASRLDENSLILGNGLQDFIIENLELFLTESTARFVDKIKALNP